MLTRMLDEDEFLSPFGIRASRASIATTLMSSDRTARNTASNMSQANPPRGLFGGNSNWRGPVWFPMNYLLIEVAAEVPSLLWARTTRWNARRVREDDELWQVAAEIIAPPDRASSAGRAGHRPVNGGATSFPSDPHWRDLILSRIFPRRNRRGTGCEPSDRVDGTGGETAAAERGVTPAGRVASDQMANC